MSIGQADFSSQLLHIDDTSLHHLCCKMFVSPKREEEVIVSLCDAQGGGHSHSKRINCTWQSGLSPCANFPLWKFSLGQLRSSPCISYCRTLMTFQNKTQHVCWLSLKLCSASKWAYLKTCMCMPTKYAMCACTGGVNLTFQNISHTCAVACSRIRLTSASLLSLILKLDFLELSFKSLEHSLLYEWATCLISNWWWMHAYVLTSTYLSI